MPTATRAEADAQLQAVLANIKANALARLGPAPVAAPKVSRPAPVNQKLAKTNREALDGYVKAVVARGGAERIERAIAQVTRSMAMLVQSPTPKQLVGLTAFDLANARDELASAGRGSVKTVEAA